MIHIAESMQLCVQTSFCGVCVCAHVCVSNLSVWCVCVCEYVRGVCGVRAWCVCVRVRVRVRVRVCVCA